MAQLFKNNRPGELGRARPTHFPGVYVRLSMWHKSASRGPAKPRRGDPTNRSVLESLRSEHDPLAAHIFVSRRHYRNMPDTKSGSRSEVAAQLSWKTACELGFRGNWENGSGSWALPLDAKSASRNWSRRRLLSTTKHGGSPHDYFHDPNIFPSRATHN